MKRLKSHFVFNRSERNGIFVLVLVIVVLQAVYFYGSFSPEPVLSVEQQEEVLRFQRSIDSLKKVAAVEDSVKLYPFNPNFISDYKGYVLGMSVEEIDRLHAFRARDQWIRSAEEFQQITGISDSLLLAISSLFKFPEFNVTRSSPTPKPKERPVIEELNTATAEALMQVNGIGEVLSKRIVSYRESLGGFVDEVQLYDVYGLSPEVVERVLERFRILTPLEKEKQDLNDISVLALSEIPGFTYELARAVVEYRAEQKAIRSFEELANIKGFPVEIISRIQLYLAIVEEKNLGQDAK